ncbi:MAG: MlaD family protein [Chitinophagales bacterium]
MSKSGSKKFKLGLFVVISTILLIVALYLIGSKQNLFGKTFKVSAVFSNVNGLQLGNNVRYSGINVGTVKKIQMVNDSMICVDMVIENKVLKHLKKNAVATIKTDGLVGSMTINIEPVNLPSEPLQPGDTIQTISNVSTSDMLSTLSSTNDNVAALVIDLLKITASINEGEGTIGMLLNDTEMANNLQQTVANLVDASENATKTINDLNQIIASINYDESLAAVLLSDTATANQMKSIVDNLDRSSEEINAVIANVNDLVLNVKNGKGTLDYLVNDTTLVNDIDATIQNIKQGSELLNEDLEALKHNFLLRGYFKKLERQKAKEEKAK